MSIKMILEDATFEAFGYYPSKLPLHGCKPILAACELCGKFRITSKNRYRTLCNWCSRFLGENQKGITFTNEHKCHLCKNHADVTGEQNPFFGKKHTEESRTLQSAAHMGKKNNNYGKKFTEEHKAKMSAAQKGEKGHNWQGGISFEPYCIKFNKEYKDYIRSLFGNICFLCDLSEADNGEALSVHHPHYNKQRGCDGTVCSCVPLCKKCHGKTGSNRDYYEALITEMLKPIEAWM